MRKRKIFVLFYFFIFGQLLEKKIYRKIITIKFIYRKILNITHIEKIYRNSITRNILYIGIYRKASSTRSLYIGKYIESKKNMLAGIPAFV